MPPTKPTDWRNEPLPAKRTYVALDRKFSADEMRKIKLGLMPQQQEDKWFLYWDDSRLWMHRSWTGFCLFVVRFEADGDGARMVGAEVNREPEQYSATDDERDAQMISYLIDVLLLGRDAQYPSAPAAGELGALEQWSMVGRAMLRERPEEEQET
jgi:hypothetical protein